MVRESREELRAEGDRIARLLEEARSSCGPNTWPSVERLLEAIFHLQGEALGWMVEKAEEKAPGLLQEMVEDELLASLLRLHGLHPEAVEQRIRRGLERLRPALGVHVRDLRLVEVDAEGRAVIGVTPKENARLDAEELANSITHAVLEEAPELRSVRVVDERLRRASLGMASLKVSP